MELTCLLSKAQRWVEKVDTGGEHLHGNYVTATISRAHSDMSARPRPKRAAITERW